MTGIAPQALQTLGWTLLHFVWQGAAIAALFAAATMLCRSANARYTLGVATLILVLATPPITFVWLSRAPAPIVQSATQAIAETVSPAPVQAFTATSAPFIRTLVTQANQPTAMLWLVEAWFVGVALLAARTAGGLFWIARIRRRDIEPLADEIHHRCLAIQRRMGLNRLVRYARCRGLDSPMVLGWFRPVVLVTTQALTGLTVQQLQAVIAHELAHIRRFDAFVNFGQIVVETLLFYHPAVWWVSRRMRVEREVCCDQEALAVCGEPVSYARALALMEEWRAAPSVAMAANHGPLTERVLRLLGMSDASGRTRVASIGISALCVAAALLAGHAFVAVAHAALDENTPETPAAVPSAPVPPAAPVEPAPPTAKVEATPATKPIPAARPKAAPQPRPQAAQKSQSYVDGLAAAGFSYLRADELIAMKVQGITPDYIQDLIAIGLHPTINELIAMKVQDVSADYARATQSVVIDPSIEELIAMKVNGVTPQFVRELQAAGLDARYGRDVIAAKVNGITPELVKSAIEQGISDLRLGELIMLKNADVL